MTGRAASRKSSVYPTRYDEEKSVFPIRDARIRKLRACGWEPPAIAEQVGWPTVTVCVVLDILPEVRWFPKGEICI